VWVKAHSEGERMTKTWLSLSIVVGLVFMLAVSGCADMPRQRDGSQRNDYDTSLEEFQSTAERGDAKAQVTLGVLYAEGKGVPQDYQEALRWYRLAMNQGDAYAQNNLGGMYDRGKEVPQDYTEAVKWFRLAANQGVAAAQYNLGVMFFKGQGVPRNYVRAYMWASLAATQGAEHTAKGLEIFEKEMTPDHLAKAQRLAREWKAKAEWGRF